MPAHSFRRKHKFVLEVTSPEPISEKRLQYEIEDRIRPFLLRYNFVQKVELKSYRRVLSAFINQTFRRAGINP